MPWWRGSAGEDTEAPTAGTMLIAEVTSTALYYEGQSTASLGMLRNLVDADAGLPGRKTLLLVSGGMIASDTPGGRPDLGSLGMQVGREAATANTAIYTLFIDTSLHDQFGAETRSGDRTAVNKQPRHAVLARWLEQFTGPPGARSSPCRSAMPRRAHADSDRAVVLLPARRRAGGGGSRRPHARSRREDDAVERHDAGPAVGDDPDAWRERRRPRRPQSRPPPRRRPRLSDPGAPRRAPDVVALADVFDRGNREAFEKALAQSNDLANVIRGLRQSDSPWPENRRRTAVFALELGLAGLRSDNRDARDEGGRLLAEYHVRVREPAGADAFECWWLVTETTALEGLFMPDNALQFIPRALQRCPSNARLNLAYALVSEQQWIQGRTTAAQEPEILNRYEQAMKFPETEPEARVRAARFLLGLGQFDRGLALLDGIKASPADLELRYFASLVRGQLLRARPPRRGRGRVSRRACRLARCAVRPGGADDAARWFAATGKKRGRSPKPSRWRPSINAIRGGPTGSATIAPIPRCSRLRELGR